MNISSRKFPSGSKLAFELAATGLRYSLRFIQTHGVEYDVAPGRRSLRHRRVLTATIQIMGIANGGGDCTGLNGVIRGAIHAAILKHGWRVVGKTRLVDPMGGIVRTARAVGITFGDQA